MRRFASLVSALLLPIAPPLLLGTASAVGLLLVSEAAAQAQSPQSVARVAEAITVRLEGVGSLASGVLVQREGNRYTVLTAWHVVSAQNPGEELDVITPDGKRYPLEQGSIQRLGQVDLAVLTFSSPQSYEIAPIDETKSVSSGSPVYVGGFPLPTSAVPSRIWRFVKGDVIANATVAIPNGYQLLYDNPTLPGMSGGPVLNGLGRLVGIHANAERHDQISERTGKAVATGTNQAVPIDYYRQWITGATIVATAAEGTSADNYLAQAKDLLGQKGKEQEVIRLSTQALGLKASAEAYFYRAYAKDDLGDKQGAIADLDKALAINPKDAVAYYNRGNAKSSLGDAQGAVSDYSKALAIDSQYATAYLNRGNAKSDLGDKQGAIADYSQVLAIDPHYVDAYLNRAIAKYDLGDMQGAIADYNQILAIDPRDASAFNNRGNAKSASGDKQGAIADYNQALAINPQYADAYYNRGIRKSDLGDKQGAIEDYTKAILINPKDADIYVNRGYVMVELGNQRAGIVDYDQALSIDPRSVLALFNRGLAKYGMGEKKGAISDLNRALTIDPKNADVYSLRGIIREEIGNLRQACLDWRAAADLGSTDAAEWVQKQCR